MARTKVFISYSHKDRRWLEQLQTVLRPLVREQEIDLWDDTKIDPGAIWKQTIRTAIAETRVAVLLVSAEFLASEFIATKELPPLLHAAKEEGVTILWVPISHCLVEETPIIEFQATSSPKRPLDGLSKAQRGRELTDLARRIRDAIRQPEPDVIATPTSPAKELPTPAVDTPPPPVVSVPKTEPVVEVKTVALVAPTTIAEYLAQMVAIPGGTFSMGSDTSGQSDESPAHSVTLSSYRLGRTPVTVGMWEEYCEAKGKVMPEAPSWGWIADHPIVRVSWEDVNGFCDWASQKCGMSLSLPTEAQWEFAARGTEGGEYPWGNEWDASRCVNATNSKGSTAKVGSIEAGKSWCGALDLSGNVWEWCHDWYNGDYYSTPEATKPDPTGPKTGTGRIVRGGSWYDVDTDRFRGAFRNGYRPDTRYSSVGFRLSAGPLKDAG